MPLLDARWSWSALPVRWPADILDACRRAAIFEATIELARRAELSRVLEAFLGARIRPLVLKGSAIAYTHYAHPGLRPRSDTDLFVPLDARTQAENSLRRLGYENAGGMTGQFVCYQATWSREDGVGVAHSIDLHWRINNSQILANLLTYDECDAGAVALAPLGPHARGLGPVHAALFACLHRAGHRNSPIYVDGVPYPADNCLIWLHDIHLLYTNMSDQERRELLALAATKGLRAVCHDALESCRRYFSTSIAPDVLEQLAESGAAERSAIYLRAAPALQMWGDLMAIGSIGDRIRWLGEVAFPPAQYMRTKYPGSSDAWLPLLYARRGVRGLWRLANPSPRDRPH